MLTNALLYFFVPALILGKITMAFDRACEFALVSKVNARTCLKSINCTRQQ